MQSRIRAARQFAEERAAKWTVPVAQDEQGDVDHVGKVRVGPGLFRLIQAHLGRQSIRFGGNRHAVRIGESAKAETAEVSAEFEGLEDVAPDSGGEEFGDGGSADGG